MNTVNIEDPIFLEAIEAIDTGDKAALEKLLAAHPSLVDTQLKVPAEGYFKHPYLLWFVADNPIRNGTLPANIVAITSLIIEAIKREKLDSSQHQLDYTLGLVATGSTPRQCAVQIELIDLLVDAGANTGSVHGALAHHNLAAAERLIERGAIMTLTAAICLDHIAEVEQLAQKTGPSEWQVALMAAAFYGKADAVDYLITLGADPNAYLDPGKADGFHSHATALHQAVFSTSLEAVKVLVEAGARLDLVDRMYSGTPLGWAQYLLESDELDKSKKQHVNAIADYLRSWERQ